jgi:hypothetical protein
MSVMVSIIVPEVVGQDKKRARRNHRRFRRRFLDRTNFSPRAFQTYSDFEAVVAVFHLDKRIGIKFVSLTHAHLSLAGGPDRRKYETCNYLCQAQLLT